MTRYKSPWPVYAMAWTNRPEKSWRLAIGSFVEEYKNKLQVVELRGDNATPVCVAEADHFYPMTKVLWMPYKENALDLLATTGDFLRVWQVTEDGQLDRRSQLSNVNLNFKPKLILKNKSSEFCAPITSFDWNTVNVNLVGTSSIDTTCTMWDIGTQQVITQLIAHDKEVYDMAFTPQTADVFASVGADGSVRMFDLRNLEHSTIIYETSDATPLLRLNWNKLDPNYLATFQMDSNSVIILDIRVPSIPVTELTGQTASVNAIQWAPHSNTMLCTAGDDAQALIWDVNPNKKQFPQDPVLCYGATREINQISWSSVNTGWLALAVGDSVEMLRTF